MRKSRFIRQTTLCPLQKQRRKLDEAMRLLFGEFHWRLPMRWSHLFSPGLSLLASRNHAWLGHLASLMPSGNCSLFTSFPTCFSWKN